MKRIDGRIRVLLIGTSDFAVPIFESIVGDERFEVAGVVTQPDKPYGRSGDLKPPPVKEWARTHSILPLQPNTLKDPLIKKQLIDFDTDVSLIVAYGKLIPKDILESPKFGTVNVHPSLLPQFRGPSPIQYAIMKSEKRTGVSIMLIDEEMDHGPILQQFEYPLNNTETYKELSDTLSRLSANVVPDAISGLVLGTVRPQEQDHEKATYTKLITTNDGELFWEKDVQALEARVRALNPEPGTWCKVNEKRLKIRSVSILSDSPLLKEPGTLFDYNGSFAAHTKNGVLILDEVQPEGKRWMTGEEYVRGYGIYNSS